MISLALSREKIQMRDSDSLKEQEFYWQSGSTLPRKAKSRLLKIKPEAAPQCG